MVATDTVEHQFLLMKYLEKNNVHNVEVVLISQLKKSEVEKATPKSNFTHSDGFPRLSFFAAAKVPNEVIKKSDDKKLSSLVENVLMYQSM